MRSLTLFFLVSLLLMAVLIRPASIFAQGFTFDPTGAVETILSRVRNWNFTALTGKREVPGPGDEDGLGLAQVELKDAEVCVHMRVFNIAPSTMAHIHRGAKDVSGPVVVTLPTPDAQGNANGCVPVATTVIAEIRNEPKQFYVNVHNAEFPGGAIRGQL